MKKYIKFLLPFILISFYSCVLIIDDRIYDPNPYFKNAMKRIEKIHKKDPKREGPVSSMKILVYEKDEHKLIKLTIPFWLLNFGLDVAEASENKKYYRRSEDFHYTDLKKLKEAGPGLLIQVDEEDSKVLIWLE
ncbi:MAG: hypothetical protein AB1410_01240 [Acidobacteriota bacterium]